MPNVHIVLWNMVLSSKWLFMAFKTFGIAASASNGTPGSEKSSLLLPFLSISNCMQGAVPHSFIITVQLSGTRAWALLMSLISTPLAVRSCSMMRYCSLFSTNPPAPVSFARVLFVISSLVGPSPPVTITISVLCRHLSSVSTIASPESEVDTSSSTLTPMALRAVAIFAELVSTICPMRISSPIVHMDAVTIIYSLLNIC